MQCTLSMHPLMNTIGSCAHTLTFPDHLRRIAIFCASPLPTFGPRLYQFLVFSYRLFWTFVGLYIRSHSPFVRYIATFLPFSIVNFPLFILPTFVPCNISGICIFLVHSSLEFCSFQLYFSCIAFCAANIFFRLCYYLNISIYTSPLPTKTTRKRFTLSS